MYAAVTTRKLSYVVDRQGVIIDVGPGWDRFAMQNDGAAACARYVLERPWTEFVTGAEVRLLFSRLIQSVREQQTPRTTTFRCDSPQVRRYMRMRIEPCPDECVEIETEIEREVPRNPVHLLERGMSRSGEFLSMCSWCSRIQVLDEWCEIDKAIERLHLFMEPSLPQLTHTICGKCVESF